MGLRMLLGLPTADQGRPWMALGMKTLAGSSQRQPVTGRTGKQADRQGSKQIVRDASGWRVKFGIIPRRKPDVP